MKNRSVDNRELGVEREGSPVDRAAGSLWRPLRVATFRNLLLANVVADIGTFLQSVGAAWLMISFGAGPMYVALTQTASTLPFFLLALPAGAIGDIVNRRKLILYTQAWMVTVATVIAILTIGGLMSPWLLLALTFALSAGDAFETPTWRAILPELVKKEDLAAATALNGIEFNIARALGPALAGGLIAAVGIGSTFALNAASFVGVIFVIFRWKPTTRPRTAPVETMGGATVAAIRFVRYSPAVRALMLRAGTAIFFAIGLLALLPTIARSISGSAIGYGVLLGCFGLGAVLGALLMQPARARWSTEVVVSGAMAILGAMIVAIGNLHTLSALGLAMLVAGGAWVIFISLISALVQSLAPDWVRARVLAVHMLIFQGSMAAGSVLWGAIGERAGISTALLWAGLGTIATTALALVSRLPDATADLSPWNHWRLPTVVKENEPGLHAGPVLVTVEYVVDNERAKEFIEAVHQFERVRRRDGATRWGIFHDPEIPDRYVETFLVHSWAEHLRQHDRQTVADRKLEERVRSYLRDDPQVRHLIFARTPHK